MALIVAQTIAKPSLDRGVLQQAIERNWIKEKVYEYPNVCTGYGI
jgi:hypothetical protein